MKFSTLNRFSAEPSDQFLSAARQKGLSVKLARTLQAAAHELFPEDPSSILGSRSRFEETALQAISHDLGNLELSFEWLDNLASAVETLDLARTSEMPDPFRRVWVENKDGARAQGVVLAVRDQEIAVFCPHTKKPLEKIGSAIELIYRESSSLVSYELMLNDAVRLPGTNVLHLKRRNGIGSIGRVTKRHEVETVGFVRMQSADGQPLSPTPCKILDISIGGARLGCSADFDKGTPLHLDVFLDDGISEPLSMQCTARWSQPVPEGHHIGVQFGDLSKPQSARLEEAMLALQNSQNTA